MSQISSIEQAKRNQDRVNIFVDGKFAFSLTKDQLLAAGLSKGMQISPARLSELHQLSDLGKHYERVYHFLGLRPRSEKELRDYLTYRRQLPETQVAEMMQKLQQAGLVDDKAFAEWYVQQRSISGKHGPTKIKAELMRKGVNQDIAETALVKLPINLPLELAGKYWSKYSSLNNYERKQKTIAALLRRGYSLQEAKQVVAQLT